jgi:hypothetical protein
VQQYKVINFITKSIHYTESPKAWVEEHRNIVLGSLVSGEAGRWHCGAFLGYVRWTFKADAKMGTKRIREIYGRDAGQWFVRNLFEHKE